MNYKFGYFERLHNKKDFDAILNGGTYINSVFITVVFLPNPTNKITRLGLITKKTLGTAVARNKIKRRLREIFRLNKHRLLSGIDIIFIPRPKIVSMDYSEIESGILKMLESKNLIK